jgi:multiple sugar transport system permease protein
MVCVFPIYWITVTSLKSPEDIDGPPTYLPFADFAPSLDAWRFILANPFENLVTRFFNSLVVGITSTLITLTVASMAIYGLTRFPPRLRWASAAIAGTAAGCAIGTALFSEPTERLLFMAGAVLLLGLAFALRRRGPVISAFGAMAFMLATRILPPIVIVLPLYMMADATGTRDTLSALVLTYAAVNLPVALWLIYPIIGPRATEQEEAAQIDGASHVTILFTILMPMIRGSVVAAGLLIFLLCWNEYIVAAYLTADHAMTLPSWMVGQLSFKEAQVGGGPEEVAHLSAAAIVMVLPALLFAVVAQRLLASTLVAKR